MTGNEYFLTTIDVENQTVTLSPIGFGQEVNVPVTKEEYTSCLMIQQTCLTLDQPVIILFDEVTQRLILNELA